MTDELTNTSQQEESQNQEQITDTFSSYLPDELRLEVFKRFSDTELTQAALVSREWKRLAHDHLLWKTLVAEKDYDPLVIETIALLFEQANEENFWRKLYLSHKSSEWIISYLDTNQSLKAILMLKTILSLKQTLCSNTQGQQEININQHIKALRRILNTLTIGYRGKNQDDFTFVCTEKYALLNSLGNLDEVLSCYKNFKANILDRNPQTEIEQKMAVKEKQRALQQGSSLDSSVYYLDVSSYNNPGTQINAQVLAEKITQKQGNLMFLDLAESDLSADDLNMVVKTLAQENCKLISLKLSGNTLNEDTIDTLIEALSNPTYNAKDPKHQLKYLNLSNTKLSSNSVNKLINLVTNEHCPLIGLDLSWNNLNASHTRQIADGLKNTQSKLQYLGLRWNKITFDDIDILADGLTAENNQLRELDLSLNNLGPAEVNRLAEIVTSPNCKLEHLELSGVDLDNNNVSNLAKAIKNPNCRLKFLDVYGATSMARELNFGPQIADAIVYAKHQYNRKISIRECCFNLYSYIKQAEDKYQKKQKPQQQTRPMRLGT